MRFFKRTVRPEDDRGSIKSNSLSSVTIQSKERSSDGHTVVRSHAGQVWLRYWIHILAIAATGASVAINFLNIYLMDSDDADAIAKLGAFQFVAKLHEALMLGSLSLAMIDVIRNGLLKPDGVPLGYVLAPVMYNNIDWLLSASFWTNTPKTRQVLSHAKAKKSSLLLFLFVMMAIIFANIAGPISAIAIVPRLGWSASAPAAAFPQFWNVSAAEFSPEKLSAAALPSTCSQGGASGGSGCPAQGSNAIKFRLNYSFSPGPQCTTQGLQSSCNTSVSDSAATNAIIRTLSVDFDLDAPSAYASTPNAAVYGTLARRFQNGIAFPFNISKTNIIRAGKAQLVEMTFRGNSGLFKPAVSTACRDMRYSEIVQLYQEKNLSTNWSSPAVTWLDNANGIKQDSFLFSYLTNSSEFKLASDCEGEECFAAIVCAIDPRWAPHKLWHNTAQPTFLFQDDPQPRTVFQDRSSTTRPVVLTKDWLELTSVDRDTDVSKNIVDLINDWGTPRLRAAQPVQATVQEKIGPTNHSVAVSVILASIVAEAMANGPVAVGDSLYNGDCNDTNPGFTFSPAICEQDPSFWVHAANLGDDVQQGYSMVTFTVRRNGWGW